MKGMTKEEMIAYFDRCAPTWDALTIRSDEKINTILDCAGVRAGVRVLDIACGTGVLFPDYLQRNVGALVGVDISPEMARIAAEKFDDPRVQVFCADAMELEVAKPFDCVVIYDAFPHFPEPEQLIARLAACLTDGGRLTIAHGMSRAQIDAYHDEVGAGGVSLDLLHEDALAKLLSPCFAVDIVIADNKKYIVSGVKRP